MSSELNQMYPVLPRGVTTPPGAVLIQMDGANAVDLVEVIRMFKAVRDRRRDSAEAESRSKASEATSSEPEPEASAAAATEEIGEST